MFNASTFPFQPSTGYPAHAIGYVYRDIVHDWPDAAVVDILKAVAAVLRPQDRVYLVTRIVMPVRELAQLSNRWASYRNGLHSRCVPPLLSLQNQGTSSSKGARDSDIIMMAAFGADASERTVPQFEVLAGAAGLTVVGQHNPRSTWHVLVLGVAQTQ